MNQPLNAVTTTSNPIPPKARPTRDLVIGLHDLRRQLDQMTETYKRHGWAGGQEVFLQAHQEVLNEKTLVETELNHRYRLAKSIAQAHADVEAAMAGRIA
jgi:hypothetical protein